MKEDIIPSNFVVTNSEGFDTPLYNPIRDISAVEQEGYVDLVDAIDNNSLPSDISVTELSFEDIDDPAKLLPKYEDVFDKLHQLETIKSLTEPKNEPKNE